MQGKCAHNAVFDILYLAIMRLSKGRSFSKCCTVVRILFFYASFWPKPVTLVDVRYLVRSGCAFFGCFLCLFGFYRFFSSFFTIVVPWSPKTLGGPQSFVPRLNRF